MRIPKGAPHPALRATFSPQAGRRITAEKAGLVEKIDADFLVVIGGTECVHLGRFLQQSRSCPLPDGFNVPRMRR
jgi:hypothetical protein